VAATDANVLIWGENGTGKEVIARSIHHQSSRNQGPFVQVDVGALVGNLFEGELFGYEKGAFTGAASSKTGRLELAQKGSLLLDEIGNLDLSLQAKLLTVLQQRKVLPLGSSRPVSVDFRLICATNRPLPELVSQQSFRQDLLYRINTVEIHLPPLRGRREDIRPLATHFLQHYAQKYERTIPELSPAAWGRLEQYEWPGNVRQLQHAMERAVVLAENHPFQPEELQLGPLNRSQSGLYLESLNLRQVEIQVIRQALSLHGGNITYAARELGLTRTSLYRRMAKYGLGEA
jgi:transcriptional regulator with PAS, ATPase and Fis domain